MIEVIERGIGGEAKRGIGGEAKRGIGGEVERCRILR